MRHVSMMPQTSEPYYRERMRERVRVWASIRQAQVMLDIENEKTAAMLRRREEMLNPIAKMMVG